MKADPEKPSYPLLSFALLVACILGVLGFLLHTVLARRWYGKQFDDLGARDALPGLTRFFLDFPAPLYVLLFVLLVSALLVKEIAVERKSLTLRLNVAALVAVALLWGAWSLALPITLARLHEGGAP